MMKVLSFVLLLFCLPLHAQTDLGEVPFANSGAPAAQAAFLQGLALLHDFEYPDAAASFREAQKADPEFAMAYWGEAMTFNHPIWMQQDADAARAVMKRAPAAKTARERDYMQTLDVLYGEGTKEVRDGKYAEAMAALHARYPDDVDATAFYALSLLGTSAHRRDFAVYMKAAALLEEVFPTHQRHPGVLHYLIHSYDDPIHAPLGMRAARLYGSVAPNAGHALHMTSHIYIALGMWDDVIDANQRAIKVSGRQRSMACGHYPTWLEYGYLQKGQFDAAEKVLAGCLDAARNDETKIDSYAEMYIQYVTSGGSSARPDLPQASSKARFTFAYADALAAAKRGDVVALKKAATQLHDLSKEIADAAAGHDMMGMNAGRIERRPVVLQQVDALVLFADGKTADGIAMLRKAVAAELAMPFEFGPPVVEKPSLELLGDQLLVVGRKLEAGDAYRAALLRVPGRMRSVEGSRAAER